MTTTPGTDAREASAERLGRGHDPGHWRRSAPTSGSNRAFTAPWST